VLHLSAAALGDALRDAQHQAAIKRVRKLPGLRGDSRCSGSNGTKYSLAVNCQGPARLPVGALRGWTILPERATSPEMHKTQCAPRFIILYAATAGVKPAESRQTSLPAVLGGSPPGPTMRRA